MMILQKNKGCRSYMEISGIGRQDSYAVSMLVNNTFKSIPECEIRNIDNEKSLLYKIDGLSLISVRYGRISPEINDVFQLMNDLSDAITEIEDYMLSPNDLVINIRNILYDSKTGKHKFMYVPDSQEGFIKQVKTLLEDIMVIYDHDDREGTVKLYDFYSRILPDNFTPHMFKELLIQMSGMPQKTEESSVLYQTAYEEPERMREVQPSYNISYDEDENKESMKKIYITGGAVAVLAITAIILLGVKGMILSFLMVAVYMIYAITGYRAVMEDDEIRKNLVISATDHSGESSFSTAEYRGISKQENKKCISSLVPFISEKELPIALTEDGEIRIGRQPGRCEYCLSEPGISRIHAVIRKNGTKVSLRDEGSTNGTYVNNKRISGGETELNYGDVVSFAGVEYYCV